MRWTAEALNRLATTATWKDPLYDETTGLLVAQLTLQWTPSNQGSETAWAAAMYRPDDRAAEHLQRELATARLREQLTARATRLGVFHGE